MKKKHAVRLNTKKNIRHLRLFKGVPVERQNCSAQKTPGCLLVVDRVCSSKCGLQPGGYFDPHCRDCRDVVPTAVVLYLLSTLSYQHFSAAAGGVNHKGQPTGRNVYLRYYPPVAQKDMGKKKRDDLPVFEQAENVDNPLRCPVKLYEFYLSKCPESIKNRTDVFYLVPERYFICNSFICHSFYYGFIYSLIHSSF